MFVQTKWDIGCKLLSPSDGVERVVDTIQVNNTDGRVLVSYMFADEEFVWWSEDEITECNNGK